MTNLDRRSRRIQDITSELRRLSLELDSLLSVSSSDSPVPSPPRPPVPTFQVGSRVRILNSRNGLQGHLGTVVRTNDAFVFFTLDSSGDLVWRSRRNLALLS